VDHGPHYVFLQKNVHGTLDPIMFFYKKSVQTPLIHFLPTQIYMAFTCGSLTPVWHYVFLQTNCTWYFGPHYVFLQKKCTWYLPHLMNPYFLQGYGGMWEREAEAEFDRICCQCCQIGGLR
jgi:hypothetical protein